MGNKSNDFRSKFQAGLHSSVHNGHNRAERFRQSDGSIIHGNTWDSNNKMGEAAKIVFNIAGLTAFIMGILTNWNNFISILLGVIGLLYAAIKCARELEEYRYKKLERKEKEHRVDRYIKGKED